MRCLIAAALVVVAALAGACDEAERDPDGRVRASGDLSVYDLRTGDCFNGGQRVAEEGGEERTVEEVTAVPCSQSHDNEVFAVFDHPAGAGARFPGEEAVNKVAEDGCLERFEAYVGHPYAGSDLQVAVIAPGKKSWAEERDRAIVCIVYGDGKLRGSQRGVG